MTRQAESTRAGIEYMPGQDAGEGASEAGGAQDIGTQAARLAETAKYEAREGAQRAREQTLAAIGKQKNLLAQQVTAFAAALHTACDQLRSEGQGSVATFADSAADLIESVGNTLGERDLNQLMLDIRDFGRRQPVLLAGGAVLIGFAASRFFRGDDIDVEDQRIEAWEEEVEASEEIEDVGFAADEIELEDRRYASPDDEPIAGSSGIESTPSAEGPTPTDPFQRR